MLQKITFFRLGGERNELLLDVVSNQSRWNKLNGGNFSAAGQTFVSFFFCTLASQRLGNLFINIAEWLLTPITFPSSLENYSAW